MNKPSCPYMDSGICYRKGCIYMPDLQCMKSEEFKQRLSIAKKLSKKHKKSVKRAKRG